MSVISMQAEGSVRISGLC